MLPNSLAPDLASKLAFETNCSLLFSQRSRKVRPKQKRESRIKVTGNIVRICSYNKGEVSEKVYQYSKLEFNMAIKKKKN